MDQQSAPDSVYCVRRRQSSSVDPTAASHFDEVIRIDHQIIS